MLLRRHAGHGPLEIAGAQAPALAKMDWNNDALYDPVPVTIAYLFTLFHEIGHLLRHGRKETFVTDDEPARKHADPRENEADDFARETLLPPPFEEELPSLTTPQQVKDLADRAGVAASIVAGRLCRDFPSVWTYKKANKLRPSIDIETLAK